MFKRKFIFALLLAILFLLLTACSTPESPTPSEADVIIPSSTKVTDEKTQELLESYDPDSGILRFSEESETLASLETGDILASTIIDGVAERGFLRKVTAKRLENGQLVLETSPASLTEAIQEAQIGYSQSMQADDEVIALVDGLTVRSLTASELSSQAISYSKVFKFDDVSLDFVEKNNDGSVKASAKVELNGSLKLSASLSSDLDIGFFSLDLFEIKTVLQEEAKLSIKASGTVSAEARKEIARVPLKSLVVWAGPIPIVFTSDIIISIGASGQVSATVETSATQTASLTLGIRYTDDKGWENLSDFDSSFDYNIVTAEAKFKARAYVAAQTSVYLYDALGAGLEAKAFIESDIAIPRNPLWILCGGVNLSIVFDGKIPIIDKSLGRYEIELAEFKEEIARAENEAPKVVLDLPATIDVNRKFFPKATVTDREDASCCDLSWSSNKEGNLGTDKSITLTQLGVHTLTLTATDSLGESSSASAEITVLNSAPVPSISVAQPVKALQPHRFAALAFDENETIECNQFSWSVSPSATVSTTGSGTDCTASISFPTKGSYSVTLEATDSFGSKGTTVRSLDVAAPPENAISINSMNVLLEFARADVPDEALSRGDLIFWASNLNLSAEASDSKGRSLSYTWQYCLNYNSATASCVTGYEDFASTQEARLSTSTEFDNARYENFVLRISVKDDFGNENFDIFPLLVIELAQ